MAIYLRCVIIFAISIDKCISIMFRNILLIFLVALPISLIGGEDAYDTLSIKPIGVDYSKYAGTDKLFMVGECTGMKGNQIVVFQNRPAFDFFTKNETYKDEQKELERAIWAEILDKDSEPIIIKGKWHEYNDRMIFLCHQILKMNKQKQLSQETTDL